MLHHDMADHQSVHRGVLTTAMLGYEDCSSKQYSLVVGDSITMSKNLLSQQPLVSECFFMCFGTSIHSSEALPPGTPLDSQQDPQITKK